MKLAAIDIGTNSTRLLICDASPLPESGKFSLLPLKREMNITRLGKNLESTGNISREQAIETIDIIRKYAGLIDKNSVENYRVVGTRVLRCAKNADWFISEVKLLTGIDVEIISGDQEAELSFTGTVQSLDADSKLKETSRTLKENDNILVLDIGGGSTEFILGNTKGIIAFSRSIEEGSVSVSEKFLLNDKPADKDIRRLEAYIDEKFSDVIAIINRERFFSVIGLAGTITTLAAVDLKLARYCREKIHMHSLNLERVRSMLDDFCLKDFKRRQYITGLDPARADIIIGGTVILIKIMQMLQQEEITVSESDILDGIIYSILQFC